MIWVPTDVSKLCELRVDLTAVPKRLFEKRRNSKGISYYQISFDLVIIPTSGCMYFQVEFNGTTYGKVQAEYYWSLHDLMWYGFSIRGTEKLVEITKCGHEGWVSKSTRGGGFKIVIRSPRFDFLKCCHKTAIGVHFIIRMHNTKVLLLVLLSCCFVMATTCFKDWNKVEGQLVKKSSRKKFKDYQESHWRIPSYLLLRSRYLIFIADHINHSVPICCRIIYNLTSLFDTPEFSWFFTIRFSDISRYHSTYQYCLSLPICNEAWTSLDLSFQDLYSNSKSTKSRTLGSMPMYGQYR